MLREPQEHLKGKLRSLAYIRGIKRARSQKEMICVDSIQDALQCDRQFMPQSQ